MGIVTFIEKLFELVAPPKAKKLDGTTEATLARSLSALPPDERGWITFTEARILFSTRAHNTRSEKRTRTAEETSFAAQHQSVINFMPVKGRVYFVRNPTAVTSIA